MTSECFMGSTGALAVVVEALAPCEKVSGAIVNRRPLLAFTATEGTVAMLMFAAAHEVEVQDCVDKLSCWSTRDELRVTSFYSRGDRLQDGGRRQVQASRSRSQVKTASYVTSGIPDRLIRLGDGVGA